MGSGTGLFSRGKFFFGPATPSSFHFFTVQLVLRVCLCLI